MATVADKKAAEDQAKTNTTSQSNEQNQQGDEDKTQGNAVPKLLIVTNTFRTQGKDKKRVEFVASDKPQDLGEHAAIALQAGVAIEPLKADE